MVRLLYTAIWKSSQRFIGSVLPVSVSNMFAHWLTMFDFRRMWFKKYIHTSSRVSKQYRCFLFFSNAVFFSKNWFGEKNLKKCLLGCSYACPGGNWNNSSVCLFLFSCMDDDHCYKVFFLSSSSNTFQIWISSVLCVLLNKFLNVVLDDLMIYLKYCQSMVN